MIKHSVNPALTVLLKCARAQTLLPVLNERFYWMELIHSNNFHFHSAKKPLLKNMELWRWGGEKKINTHLHSIVWKQHAKAVRGGYVHLLQKLPQTVSFYTLYMTGHEAFKIGSDDRLVLQCPNASALAQCWASAAEAEVPGAEEPFQEAAEAAQVWASALFPRVAILPWQLLECDTQPVIQFACV